MDCLYHYCSNEKAFNILQYHNIRMGDISKSNDSLELQLFFPELHREIYRQYVADPFPFRHEGKEGEEAFREMVQSSEYRWSQHFNSGDFSNFVTCFSATKDCLSQWRGYADDGRGCCIGFSKEAVQAFCDSTNGVLRLEKVIYVTSEEIKEMISSHAKAILKHINGLREWIVENMTHDTNDPNTDCLLAYNFDEMIEVAFSYSLRFKTEHFKEEQEWRMFLAKRAYKNGDWVYNKKEAFIGPNLFDQTLDFLNDRIDFRSTNDDLIPFCPLKFEEFPEQPIVEFWLGPKNFTRSSDAELFFKKYGYKNHIDIIHSDITYR